MPQSSEPAKGKYDKPSKQKQNFQNHHVNHDSAFDSGDHRCYGGCVFCVVLKCRQGHRHRNHDVHGRVVQNRFQSSKNERLWDNMQYVGQTAFCDSGTNAGKLMTKGIAGANTVDTSNRAYYFINTVALDTTGKSFDMSMAFDTVSILKYTYKTDPSGNYVKDDTVAPTTKREYGKGVDSNSSSDIPYVFTWFFKEHVGTDGNVSKNYKNEQSGDNKTVQRLLQLEPVNEVWYTPYGKLAFGSDGLVKSVNDDATIASSIKGVDGRNITNFSTYNTVGGTSQLFDFYVVFAPEKCSGCSFSLRTKTNTPQAKFTRKRTKRKRFSKI